MFCHVGIGKAYARSYEFFLSDVVTSSGVKKKHYNMVRVEGFLGYPLRLFVEKFSDRIVHLYRYSGRQYYVFPEDFYRLFLSLSRLIYTLYRFYRGDIERITSYISSAIGNCSDIDNCVEVISRHNTLIERNIIKRVLRGRKALTTRFMKGIDRCRDIVERYFQDLLSPHIYRYNSAEELEALLRKLFSDRVARGYRRFAEVNSPILVAKEGLLIIAREYDDIENFSIYVDDCSKTDKYAVLKLVGAYKLSGYVHRIRWVAVLGIDLLTNQLFLHYVPPTLVLRKVEVLRQWLLGLVDDFGRPFDRDFIIIEV